MAKKQNQADRAIIPVKLPLHQRVKQAS